ncbi:MAG TPA: UDP-N-acetylmuramoyl-L-alanine--D-glutamate ligase [Xanthomonadales bacterium]|nr:UDP-N-acetylmuramoyl-L-alanine--D-glutamate ligase [Xanthomonadales bacterium]
MQLSELRGKRVAILGVGREGQAAYRWLKQRIPQGTLKLFAETPPDVEFLQQLAAEDSLQISSLDKLPLSDFDVLLRSPGISPYRPALQRAIALGVQVVSPSSLWFADHPKARTICITGTKGKSTTSALTAHMLRACGQRVQLAGNIGLPLLACDDVDIDWWVIELSSYQLKDLQAEIGIGVILNLSPEHLDWHGGVEAYLRDKLRLADLTRKTGLVINAGDSLLMERFGQDPSMTCFNATTGIWCEGRQFMDGGTPLPVQMPTSMPGRHNRSNVAAALTVVRKAGFELDTAIASLGTYQSLPHRLQVLGEKQGISWVNDSISSTPVATAAALEALAGRSIVLLLGGLDRGLDWNAYVPDFRAHPPKAVITMPDNGPALAELLRKSGISFSAGLHLVASLEEAVAQARQLSAAGDIVLLSPGAPSFPRFIDFQHRGSEFARLAGF